MPDNDTIAGFLPHDPKWEADRQRLWAMSPSERFAAMRAGDLSYALLCEWSARRPGEVPRLQTGSSFAGEFEWLAAFIPELADANDTLTTAEHAMPALELDRVYHAFTCRCPSGVLWLEHPRHMTCTRCGALIEPIELVDRGAAEYYKHDRDTARRAPT